MTFRVAARALLHLGSELISSDSVAFYELIKNGLDAAATKIRIDINIRIPSLIYRKLLEEVQREHNPSAPTGPAFKAMRKRILDAFDIAAPRAEEVRERISTATSWLELADALSDSNEIAIKDDGSGMSFDELSDVYLTIGTPSRLAERDKWTSGGTRGGGGEVRPVLGEKGVGRLSAMRLGNRITVTTSTVHDARWNVLFIDWRRFTADASDMIEDIDVEPQHGPRKPKKSDCGTTIRVSGLSGGWTRERVEEIVGVEFSKLTDPFSRHGRLPVKIYFNDSQVEIPRFNRTLFEHAHAFVEAEYAIEPQPRLSGRIVYFASGQRVANASDRETTFSIEGAHLSSIAGDMLLGDDISEDTLTSLGPFSLTLYWYNRRILKAIDGIGNTRAVRSLLAEWAGGVMVFRDGYRVMPYGSPDDDWLKLDRKALASPGYKVSRAQLLGKTDISAITNPRLMDQTNREGLKESTEKRVLVRLLKWVIEDQLRGFLNQVDNQAVASATIAMKDLQVRIAKQDTRVRDTMTRLIAAYPDAEKRFHIRTLIQENRDTLDAVMEEVRRRTRLFEAGRAQLVHLAGVGLLVEVLAHELNRATAHTLDTLHDAEKRSLPADVALTFASLESQLKTLHKRLRTLDPLSTRSRQVKVNFDMITWISDTLEAHNAQFHRHAIRLVLESVPASNASWNAHAVKGMVLQVIENLVSNSVYWLKQQRRIRPKFRPILTVTVDAELKQVRVGDNGPGIEPERQELVFQAFHSTKPPGAGNGLGLYIAREIAAYHGAALYLDSDVGADGMLHTFVLDFAPTPALLASHSAIDVEETGDAVEDGFE